MADFLRARRGALRPGDIGMTEGAGRRTAGLRREEVAAAAAMSVDYYTRLEQQRGPQPSTTVLAALARALRLSRDERDYLFRLAGHAVPDRLGRADHVSPALQRVFARLSDTPALIISHLGETLAQNALGIALLGDHVGARGWARFEAWRWFVPPRGDREIYPAHDRERQSRAIVAGLRAAYGLLGPSSTAGELVAELLPRSEEFRALWERQEVAQRFADHKVLVHPELGDIEVDCQVLFTEDRAQALLVLTPEPRSEAEEKIRLLAVLGVQRFPAG
jgi:transcriptional regulator with XRE-family HTH domain